jgi:YVTN family beta-propeller protein
VVATVAVGSYPVGVSVSPDGSRVYVANGGSNNVSVINTSTNTVVATVAVGSYPFSFGNFITAGSGVCTGTPTTFTLTVNPAVTPSVSIAASPSGAITAGTSVTFTATATHGGTTPTYVWKKGGVAISGQTAATYTSTTLSNGDVITCTMTSNAACASPTTATSAGTTISVIATTPATGLNFDGVDDRVSCGTSSANLTGDLTIEFWLYNTGAMDGATVISKGYDGEFEVTFGAMN